MVKPQEYIHITCEGSLSQADETTLKSVDAVIGRSNSILGGETAVNILILISPIALKYIKEILLQLSKDKRRIALKIGDIEMKDLDPATAERFLIQVLSHIEKSRGTVGNG